MVMCHTRELAFQISKEYERFSKFPPSVKVRTFLQYYTAEVQRYPVLHILGYFYTFARIFGHVALNPVRNKGSI